MEVKTSLEAAVEKICVIVNFGMGSKLLHKAKGYGIRGGTVLPGKGTVSGRVLEFLGLTDVRKEVVMMIAERGTAYEALDKLSRDFELAKPNRGIAFTTSVSMFVGTKSCGGVSNRKDEEGAKHIMYHAITTIVERGKAEDVIEAAVKAGSKGGTILKARGSGIHETSRLFSMDIEPEKEVVLILSEAAMTEAIVESIRDALKIDDPGKGILFVQEVNKTYGVYK